jgi:hypothetical protein
VRDLGGVCVRLARDLTERYSHLLRWPLEELLIANLRALADAQARADARARALARARRSARR